MPISRTGHLRASDADRDQVAERLRAAATEGRIGFDELEERLSATLSARTYSDLDRVVADLPPSTPARRRSTLPGSPLTRAAVALAVFVPVAIAVVVAITAILSVGVMFLFACWLIFRPGYGHRVRHHRTYRQPQSGRGFWV